MLKPHKNKKFKKTEKGMAFVEAIPVLVIVVILFNFSLGFFGAIHSGILNSIASYNYTLETFRFRSDLMYFRPGASPEGHYNLSKNRVHGTIQEGNIAQDRNNQIWPATVRSIAFTGNQGDPESASSRRFAERNNDDNIWNVTSTKAEPSSEVTTPEIWVKTIYGICLNAECKSN